MDKAIAEADAAQINAQSSTQLAKLEEKILQSVQLETSFLTMKMKAM